jgi:hypothetical protein
MNEILTIPASVREHFEVSRDNSDNPVTEMLRSAGLELARNNAAYAALILAGQLGKDGIDDVTVEEVTTMELIEHRLFGIKIGEQRVPITNTRKTTRRLRFAESIESAD